MTGLKFTFRAVLCVAFVSAIAALRCYECDPCSDPFDADSTLTRSCGGSCINAMGGKLRGCATEGHGDKCGTENGKEYCSCTSDLCNSASSNVISYATSLATFCVMLLWKKI